VVLPLATLPAAPALYAEVVAGHGGDPRRWLRALLSLLLPPLFTLLHRGVAAEAHGQNTLVVLHGTAPVRVLYRDLGGVRVHPGRLGDRRLDLRGDLCTDDVGELRTTLTAALLAGVVAEHVAALARHHHTEPGQLWRVAARVLAGHGGADVAAVLGAPLPVKATTAMRLAADPLHPVWAGVDNPLAAA
jgi:siderophore synthetase component